MTALMLTLSHAVPCAHGGLRFGPPLGHDQLARIVHTIVRVWRCSMTQYMEMIRQQCVFEKDLAIKAGKMPDDRGKALARRALTRHKVRGGCERTRGMVHDRAVVRR